MGENVFSVFDNVKKLTRAAEKVGPGCEAMTSVVKVDLGRGLAREGAQCRMERPAHSRRTRGKLSR